MMFKIYNSTNVIPFPFPWPKSKSCDTATRHLLRFNFQRIESIGWFVVVPRCHGDSIDPLQHLRLEPTALEILQSPCWLLLAELQEQLRPDHTTARVFDSVEKGNAKRRVWPSHPSNWVFNIFRTWPFRKKKTYLDYSKILNRFTVYFMKVSCCIARLKCHAPLPPCFGVQLLLLLSQEGLKLSSSTLLGLPRHGWRDEWHTLMLYDRKSS